MRIILSQGQLKNFLRRRFTERDLYSLVRDVTAKIYSHNHTNGSIDIGGIIATYTRELIRQKDSSIDYFSNEWDVYENSLEAYVKSKLDIE